MINLKKQPFNSFTCIIIVYKMKVKKKRMSLKNVIGYGNWSRDTQIFYFQII